MLQLVGGNGGNEHLDQVSQQELDVLIGIQNLLMDLERMRRNEARLIRERLRRGARIEPGAHRARITGGTLVVS